MPDSTEYKYHLFISYSSADSPWASALEEALRRQKVRCFLDQTRLEAGRRWEPQLIDALSKSRHLVVLWSERARGSAWVAEELARFKVATDPDGRGAAPADRLLFAVNLEGTNATLAAYQGISKPPLQAAYKVGNIPSQLTDAAKTAWHEVVTQLAASALAAEAARPVPVAVLALTQQVLAQSFPTRPELTFVKSLEVEEFFKEVGAENSEKLKLRYGPTPFDWHPFGTSETIGEILNELLSNPDTGINSKLAGLKRPQAPVRWEYLDVVTPMMNELDQLVARLSAPAPCLIVIDPISLFSERIWRRYVSLVPCFRNPRAAIVLPTPSPASDPLVFLRRCLTEHAKVALQGFFDPIPYDPKYANCGVNIGDTWDIRRLVLGSLARQFSSSRGEAPNPILHVSVTP